MNSNSKEEFDIIESCLRFLKTLAQKDLLSIEECHYGGILKKFDEFLLNSICYEYISGNFILFFNFLIKVILEKICENTYYRQIIINNTNLIDKYLSLFSENENKKVKKIN